MPNKLNYKILIADSDGNTVESLQGLLEREGYEVKTVSQLASVLATAERFVPDLVFLSLDSTLHPDQADILAIGKSLKNHPNLSNTLLVYLSEKEDETTEASAFESDADAFLTKPIRPRALIGRLRSLFNRRDHRYMEMDKVVLGNLTLDRSSNSLFYNSHLVPVAQKEFEILYILARHPNKIFTREELIHQVWGMQVYVLARTVDVHIHKLREKIGEEYISTVKGLGYRLNWKF